MALYAGGFKEGSQSRIQCRISYPLWSFLVFQRVNEARECLRLPNAICTLKCYAIYKPCIHDLNLTSLSHPGPSKNLNIGLLLYVIPSKPT